MSDSVTENDADTKTKNSKPQKETPSGNIKHVDMILHGISPE